MYSFVTDKRVRPVPTGRRTSKHWVGASSASAPRCFATVRTRSCCALGRHYMLPAAETEVVQGKSPNSLHKLRLGDGDGALGVEFARDGLDHLGDPAGDLAVRVATLAQLGLHSAFQQRDHVLDHAVQFVR